METYDPNNMRDVIDAVSSTEMQPDDYLIKFVENSLFLESQSHHWHLQCELYSTHEELNDFYQELPQYVDDFIEGLMSERGPIFSTGSSFVFQSLDVVTDVLEDYVQQCNTIHELMSEEEDYGSVNKLEDIISLVDSTLYKLKVLK